MKETGSKKLSVKLKFGYGICDIGGNLFFTIVGFWIMNYLTDTVGLLPAAAGTALAIGKVWDAVTDPMAGYLSDRTRSRWGKRLPWILFGAVPLFITCFFMFTNPSLFTKLGAGNQTGLFWWALLAFSLFSTAYTVVNIPYSSLTPELTQDYNERTSLNGYRMSLAVVGTMLGAGAALPIVNAVSPGADKSMGWSVAGGIFGAIMMITALITFFMVKKHGRLKETEVPKSKTNIIRSYMSALSSRPYLLILIPWVMNMIAITIVQGVLKYYFDYIYKKSELLTVGMGILILTALLFIPVWVKISQKIGKKKCYMIGMSIIAANLLLFFLFAHHAGVIYAFITMFLTGIGLSTTYVFPWSIIPDAVEYDYVQNGERREGVFYGMWTFVSKIGSAFALALMGWVMKLSGYVAKTELTASAKLGIRLLVGPIAAGFFLIGVLVLSFYPITEEKYKEIRQKAEKMEEGTKRG